MSKLIYQTFLSLLWRFEFNIHKISHYITWWKVIHGLWLFSMFPWWHAFLLYFYPPTAFGKMAYYFVTIWYCCQVEVTLKENYPIFLGYLTHKDGTWKWKEVRWNYPYIVSYGLSWSLWGYWVLGINIYKFGSYLSNSLWNIITFIHFSF